MQSILTRNGAVQYTPVFEMPPYPGPGGFLLGLLSVSAPLLIGLLESAEERCPAKRAAVINGHLRCDSERICRPRRLELVA